MPLLGTVNAACLPQDEAELGMRQICLSDAGQVCKRVLEDIPKHYVGVFLDCYVVMPDHIHMLLMLDDTACTGGQGSGRPTIQKILHAFKRISSKQAGVSLWQDSFYEHVVRNETDLKEIRQYIIGNPMKSTIGHSTP